MHFDVIRRYASTVERNPEDYDALYNWALVLQVFLLYFINKMFSLPGLLLITTILLYFAGKCR